MLKIIQIILLFDFFFVYLDNLESNISGTEQPSTDVKKEGKIIH